MTTFMQDEPQVKWIYGLESKIYKLEAENKAIKEEIKRLVRASKHILEHLEAVEQSEMAKILTFVIKKAKALKGETKNESE